MRCAQPFIKCCGIAPEKIRLRLRRLPQHRKIRRRIRSMENRAGFASIAKGPRALLAPELKNSLLFFEKPGSPYSFPEIWDAPAISWSGLGNPLTWCSSCHGAGRARSRVKSSASWRGRDTVEYMAGQGVKVLASSRRTVAEEMPDAYKDVDAVVAAVQEADLRTWSHVSNPI